MVPQHSKESRNEQGGGFVCKAVPTLIENCCPSSSSLWFCLRPFREGLEESCLSRAASPPSPKCILTYHVFQRAAGAEGSDTGLFCVGNFSLAAAKPCRWAAPLATGWSSGREMMSPVPQGEMLIFLIWWVSFAPSRLVWFFRFGEEGSKMNLSTQAMIWGCGRGGQVAG